MTAPHYLPHLDDPDDPNELFMSAAEIERATKVTALLSPELVAKGSAPVAPPKVNGATFAEWASVIAKIDIKRIDNAIRSGLVSGLDNTEIARKVIGSVQLHGLDGVTETTRQDIARLGRAILFPRKRD